MNRMIRGRHLYTLLLVALSVTGAGVILLKNATYGVGLHWDSIRYIAVARSLLAGEGFWSFSGFYAAAPPLYPALLAVTGFLSGFDPHAVAGPLNALLFGLTILVAGHWLRQCCASRWLALWGCLAVTFALPLSYVASLAMSEPAFILFVTLALFHADRFLREGQRAALIWAALFTALACLTRYMGLAFVMALPPLLLLQSGVRLLKKVKHSAIFVLISVFPISLWLLRNMLLGETPFGLRHPPRHTPQEYLDTILTELARWILPSLPSAAQSYGMALAAAALFVLAIAVGFALIRLHREPALWRKWSSFCLCGGFALVYLISVVAVGLIHWVGLQNTRFWAPVYIPLLFALVFLLDRFLIWLRPHPGTRSGAVQPPVIRTYVWGGGGKMRGWLAVVLGILLFIWLGHNIRLTRRAIIGANQGREKGYAAPEVVNNDVVRFMRETQVEGMVFGNEVLYFYIYPDTTNVFRYIPHGGIERVRQIIEDAADDTYLVWFYDFMEGHRYSYGVPELEAIPELEQVAKLDSGVIFRLNREQAKPPHQNETGHSRSAAALESATLTQNTK